MTRTAVTRTAVTRTAVSGTTVSGTAVSRAPVSRAPVSRAPVSRTVAARTLTTSWLSQALASTDWVDATPFRAHLHYLVGAAGISGRVIAQFCGIPTQLADRLLAVGEKPTMTGGTPIRRARRISHYCAARLLSVRPGDLAQLRWGNVDSTATLTRLDRLVDRGHDLGAVAAAVAASTTELALLRTHRWVDCPQLLAMQVAAAGQVLLHEQTGTGRAADDRVLLTLRAG